MARTYLSTDPGDVERWAAEYDAVPVREGDGYALVREGEADLDQGRLRWDEFHDEVTDTVVVLKRSDDEPDRLAVVDRTAYVERMGVSPGMREEIFARLGDGETVTVPASEDDAEIDAGLAAGAVAEATDAPRSERLRTDPEAVDAGKTVVAHDGDEVGMVAAVEDGALYVDPHPGLTESALATLGWSGVDDEDVRVDPARVDHVTSGTVRLGEDVESQSFEETTAGR